MVQQAAQRGGLAVATAIALASLGALSFALASAPGRSSHTPDDAPGQTAKRKRFGAYEVSANAVSINKPRAEIYAFWRDFKNLPTFMENVDAVQPNGSSRSTWTIKAPAGQTVDIETQIVTDRPDELIAWRAVAGSDIETEGRVMFRDGGTRGTIVEAIVAYRPPGGTAGKWIAKLFQREPDIQGRQELKRLKMLLETGEIALAKPRHHQPAPGSEAP